LSHARTVRRGKRERDTGGGLGDDPEVQGLVEEWEVAPDLESGRQMGKGFFQEWLVFRAGKGFDGDEGVAEGLGEGVGRFELFGPGRAELLVIGRWVGVQKGDGLGREAVPVVFEEPGEDRALEAGDDGGVGEQVEEGNSGARMIQHGYVTAVYVPVSICDLRFTSDDCGGMECWSAGSGSQGGAQRSACPDGCLNVTSLDFSVVHRFTCRRQCS